MRQSSMHSLPLQMLFAKLLSVTAPLWPEVSPFVTVCHALDPCMQTQQQAWLTRAHKQAHHASVCLSPTGRAHTHVPASSQPHLVSVYSSASDKVGSVCTSTGLQSPKSDSFTCPFAAKSRLSGLMSLCTRACTGRMHHSPVACRGPLSAVLLVGVQP